MTPLLLFALRQERAASVAEASDSRSLGMQKGYHSLPLLDHRSYRQERLSQRRNLLTSARGRTLDSCSDPWLSLIKFARTFPKEESVKGLGPLAGFPKFVHCDIINIA